MTNIGAGEIIYDLRKKIQEIQTNLEQLGAAPIDMPEMIVSANLLRSNEYLSKTNDQKTKLLVAYEQYSKALEELLLTVFDIQKDLKNILKDMLKEQSSLISNSSKKQSKSKSKKK